MNFKNLFKKETPEANVFDSLTQREKLAALNLMVVFGGSSSGTPLELDRINRIISEEAALMKISPQEMHNGFNLFSGMDDMIDNIKKINKRALERLFWAYYRIFAASRSEQGVFVLMKIYRNLGFSEVDCVNILEQRTGERLSHL